MVVIYLNTRFDTASSDIMLQKHLSQSSVSPRDPYHTPFFRTLCRYAPHKLAQQLKKYTSDISPSALTLVQHGYL
jgi:hypothetical protein